jgi:hypothetical protein
MPEHVDRSLGLLKDDISDQGLVLTVGRFHLSHQFPHFDRIVVKGVKTSGRNVPERDSLNRSFGEPCTDGGHGHGTS